MRSPPCAGFLFDIESIYSNKITDIRSNVVVCHIFCLNIWFVINYLYICGVFTTIRVSFPREHGINDTAQLGEGNFPFFYLMRLLNRHVPAYADNSPLHNLQKNLRRCCHVPYFLLKYLSSNNFFVYLQPKSRMPPMDLRLRIDICAALPHSPREGGDLL